MFTYVMLFLISIIGALCTFHCWVRGGRRGKLVNKIPGPKPLPLIGDLLRFLKPLEELFSVVRSMNLEFYPIHRIWSINVPVINIQHPDDVEALLSSMKHIEKSLLYNFLHPWLGTGLLTSTGAKWQERRRILTPAFHFNVLQEFTGVFVEQGARLVEFLNSEGGEVVHDLVPLLSKCTLNSICETAMGTPLDGANDTLKEYRSSVYEMGDILLHRLLRPWLHVDWIFSMTPKSRNQAEALKVLHGFSTKIIKERKQYHEQTGGEHLKSFLPGSSEKLYSFDENPVPGKRRMAMLDLMISASKLGSIDDEGIREEVDTFMFEGHDTTAMAMCFALMLLAEHKGIQDKARAEVNLMFEESGDKMSVREIQRLSYLECCIKESLRLYPSVPFISRNITEDLKLKNYVIPGDSIVHVHIYDLHRDPNFWPNPLIYDPDRFLPEMAQGRHPFAFLPFSAGPRNCIGQKFAMLELKTLIATLLRHFYLEPIDLSTEARFFPDLVLRPVHPIRIKFIPITHN